MSLDLPISQFTPLSNISGSELVPCVFGGNDYIFTLNQLKIWIAASTSNFKVYVTIGTSTAYTVVIPNITTYSALTLQAVQLHIANGNNPTINFNGLGPLTMRIFGNTNLITGYCNTNLFVTGVINGAYFDIETVTNNISTGF